MRDDEKLKLPELNEELVKRELIIESLQKQVLHLHKKIREDEKKNTQSQLIMALFFVVAIIVIFAKSADKCL